MKTQSRTTSGKHLELVILLAIWPIAGFAQVPVDDSGNPIGDYYEQDASLDDDDLALLPPADLQDLVGSIALYPDDLLAIILPAATYPLQLVEASRFLEELDKDPSLQPDDDWDDSVVALTNYPEVIQLLNADLDWTWQLGEAVVSQQADVISAIESFRDRAYAAGNLKSDGYQDVTNDDGIIEITPVNEEIIYVPYYEPERVVVYQPQPVYYYHPQPYPVYNYPYPYGHSFRSGFFWGVTTAFTIGWATDYLHVYHHSYYGHPYYSYTYNHNWWYRRPSINVHNTYYVNNYNSRSRNYYQNGDQWRSNNTRHLSSSGRQITRTRYQPGKETRVARNSTSSSFAPSSGTNSRSTSGFSGSSKNTSSRNRTASTERRSIDRGTTGQSRSRQKSVEGTAQTNSSRSNRGNEITFRDRDGKSSLNQDRQASTGRSSTGTRSRQANVSAAKTKSATATKAPSPKIRFEPRNDERLIAASRGRSDSSPQTSRGQRSTAVTRNTSAAATRQSSQRKVAPTTRVASEPARSSTRRSQATAPRVEKSAAPRKQTQRQTTRSKNTSRSGDGKSDSGSASSRKSESSSRSSNKKSGNDRSRSRRS